METAVVDEFLKPSGVARLVRLGRPYDGGYLVDERSVACADLLLSLGLNDDWSFESAFRKVNPCPLVALDGTVGRTKFLKEVVKSIPRVDDPRILLRSVRTLVDYEAFFTGDARHVPVLVGMERRPRFLSLNSVFADYVPASARNVFLKIDIEGWEYRILDELVQLAERVCGMVIEFHSFDLHRERVRDFLRKLPLSVCHVHCNNFEPLNEAAVPLVLEVSLTKFPAEDGTALQIPNALDMPNDRRYDDYRIEFRSRP